MKNNLNKTLLLQRIQSSRRQLERCLFYFKRSTGGGLEISARLKYSEEEMTASGVAGNWSMKDVLANVSACEQSFIQSCQAPLFADPECSGCCEYEDEADRLHADHGNEYARHRDVQGS